MTVNRMMGAAGALALLAGCGGGGSQPTGQVVATVDGQEITSSQLAMELGGAKANSPEAQKRLERAALQAIVNRRLLAKAAHDQELDKSPAFAMQQEKANDLVAIAALQEKLRAGVPAPSNEEVEQLVSTHPDSFGQRKIYVVDQIITGLTQQVIRELVPLKTLPEVEALLRRRNLPFRRGASVIDGGTIDPDTAAKIAQLPAGEVFVVPGQGNFTINQIRDARVEPIAAADAAQLAKAMIQQKRTQQLVQNQMAQIIKTGESSVKYNAAYAEKPAPKAAAAAK